MSPELDKANYGLLINVLTWKFMAVDFNLLNFSRRPLPNGRPRTFGRTWDRTRLHSTSQFMASRSGWANEKRLCHKIIFIFIVGTL